MKKGWEIKKLGEVSEYFNGLTYSPKDVSDKGTIVLRSSNIQNDELDFSDLVRVNVNIKEKLFLKEGDILMCSRNGSQRLVGKTAPILNLQEPMTFGTFMMIIRSEFSPYLLWFFKTDKFKKQISGGENTMINQVTRYMLDEIKIPLPPLPEQQRIVSILDKAFAAIERSRNAAEQNLKNAKELFESYLQGVFEGKVHGNKSEALENLCELVVDCEHKTAPLQETGYPSIRTPNIGKGELILENVNRVSYETYLKWTRRAKPQSGDLILAREAPAGNIAVIPDNIEVCLGQRTVLIRPKKDKLVSKYLAYLVLSKEVQEKLLSHSTGATVEHINMKDIRAFKIYNLLLISEQQHIVTKIESLSAETKRLEAIYEQKLLNLEELKKSILQKAFAGELRIDKSRRDDKIIENKINQ